jgi:hypothetical protein
MVAAKIEVTANRIAANVTQGHGNSRRVRQLRQQLDALCRQNQTDPQEALREALDAEMDSLAQALAARIVAGQGSTASGQRLRARFDILCRLTGTQPRQRLDPYFNPTFEVLARSLVDAQNSERPDRALVSGLRRKLRRMERLTGESARNYVEMADSQWIAANVQIARDELVAERLKDRPDPKRVQHLEQRFLTLATKYNGKEIAEVRVKRVAVHAAQAKLRRAIDVSGQPATPEQTADLKRLDQQEDELRLRMGDPLISIEAPTDAQQVVALMPGGEIKRLLYNAQTQRWEARFDVPTYAAEGEYTITVVIVLRDGTRKTIAMRYRVDTTPPTGAGRAQLAADGGSVLRLQLDASEDTARVKAVLPWGEVVELRPAAQPHRFFALVPLPATARNRLAAVTYILTDRAHNRTSLRVDMTADRP